MRKSKYKELFSEDKEKLKFGYWQVLGNIIIYKSQTSVLCLCTYCNITTKLISCRQLILRQTSKCRKCRDKEDKTGITYKGIIPYIFSKIKSSAKERELEFDITIEILGDLFEKQQRKCAYTGIELILKTSPYDKAATASLDRIDSKIGYIEKNIQWVHKDINKMKNEFKTEYFLYLCESITNNIKNGLTKIC